MFEKNIDDAIFNRIQTPTISKEIGFCQLLITNLQNVFHEVLIRLPGFGSKYTRRKLTSIAQMEFWNLWTKKLSQSYFARPLNAFSPTSARCFCQHKNIPHELKYTVIDENSTVETDLYGGLQICRITSSSDGLTIDKISEIKITYNQLKLNYCP